MIQYLLKRAALVAGFLAVAAAPSVAGDPYHGSMKDVPAYYSVSDWSGIYVSGSVGYSFGSSSLRHEYDPPGTTDSYGLDGNGLTGTVALGFDRQLDGRFVWGLFADYTFQDLDKGVSLATPDNLGLTLALENTWAVGGRIGVVHESALWYVAAGYTGIDASLDNLDTTMHGYFIGAGFERKLHDNFRWKVEYRYSDYGRSTLFSGATGCCDERVDVESDVHSIRIGLSYVFGHRETITHEPMK